MGNKENIIEILQASVMDVTKAIIYIGKLPIQITRNNDIMIGKRKVSVDDVLLEILHKNTILKKAEDTAKRLKSDADTLIKLLDKLHDPSIPFESYTELKCWIIPCSHNRDLPKGNIYRANDGGWPIVVSQNYRNMFAIASTSFYQHTGKYSTYGTGLWKLPKNILSDLSEIDYIRNKISDPSFKCG